ncbi:MAG: hypothetical protein DRP95_04125 [Candidatus Latescibacterota bacterium]|nr:MAG: hypothetical protein DRP95_04125 [Candidatus Latescibacterota bacterium]
MSGRSFWKVFTVVVLGIACGKEEPSPPRSPPPIRVEVLNGCGKPGLAGRVARFLREQGLDVVNGNGSNASHFNFLESIVVDRCGDPEKARYVARVLGIPNCIQQVYREKYHIEEVTVILGKDVAYRFLQER